MVSSSPETPDTEARLTKNALAFLRRSIYGTTVAAEAEDPHQVLTFAVLDLAVAIEVLLKARLAREHWSLIVERVDQADLALLTQGTLTTVKPAQAIARLDGIVKVPLIAKGGAKGGVDRKKQIEETMTLRNRAAHFTLAGETEVGIRTQLGTGLAFMLWFLQTEYQDSAEGETLELVHEAIDEIAAELGKIDELVKTRLLEIEDDLAAAAVCVDCPTCGQPTLILGDALARCAFCLAAGVEAESISDAYVESVTDLSRHSAITGGGEWPVYICPECGVESLVHGIVPRRPAQDELNPQGTPPCDRIQPSEWGCFSCGLLASSLEIELCSMCGAADSANPCQNCWAELTS